MRLRLRDAAANALLLLAGVGVAVGLAEAVLRATSPDAAFGAAQVLPWLGEADTSRLYTLDPELGFRPNLDSEAFDAHGAHRNEYSFAKQPGRTRVLFIGDSVTARGRIVDALREVHGDADFEYWNAGVESFNTVQEVAFYRKYNAALEPDHVVLTFHLNDYETTPIAFRDDAGRLVVFAPNQPVREIVPWLFEHSYLYRLWLGRVRVSTGGFLAVAEETESALRELRDALAATDTRLSVIVLPLLQRPEKWARQQVQVRQRILGFLEAEGIRHFDLLPALREALAEGVKVQERSGDTWHPNAEAGRRFARYLRDAELLRNAASH